MEGKFIYSLGFSSPVQTEKSFHKTSSPRRKCRPEKRINEATPRGSCSGARYFNRNSKRLKNRGKHLYARGGKNRDKQKERERERERELSIFV